MATKSGGLDYWRKYFRSADSDIFDVIEYAISVAALDRPKEFRIHRDRIAEKLFSCRLLRCIGCDRVELAVPDQNDDVDGGFGGDVGGFGEKESKVNNNNSSTNDGEVKRMTVSNYSFDEAEALTEEIEEESQIVREVLRIKDVLSSYQDESDGVLFESLRRLQLMELSVETLKATEIGKTVNGLRKHGAKQIRHLVRTLIDGWKDMVDQWVSAAAAIQEGSPDSVNPSVLDEEEGLPSPPLDEGAFLATQTTSIELSQFFDGMDDDGNPRHSGEFDKNRGNGRKSGSENQYPKSKQQYPHAANVAEEDRAQIRKQETANQHSKAFNTESGPGRPPKPSLVHNPNGVTKLQRQPDQIGVQKKSSTGLQDKAKHSDDVSDRVKLEAAKRKLHEGYQQAENAKKQRTIQVMELHDLPKQGLGHRNPHMKPGTNNRHWANGRR